MDRTNRKNMSDMAHLEFDEACFEPILSGEKTCAIRYGLEDHIEAGDKVVCTLDRVPFAVARIEDRAPRPVQAALRVARSNGWTHGAENTEDLLDRLNARCGRQIEAHHYVDVLGMDVVAGASQ